MADTNFSILMEKIMPEITPAILWGFLGFFFLIFFVMTVVFVYHWRKYGEHTGIVTNAEIIYFAGSGAIFWIALIGLVYFSLF